MSKHIYIDVGAKTPTVGSCVKFTSNSYEDTITKNIEYTGESQMTISFINSCSVPFTVNPFVLFNDNSLGGNFEARIAGFSIGANQTINIPLRYFGINKSATTPKNFNLEFNGSTINFKLNIQTPFVNTPPVIAGIDIVLENRQGKVFTLADFTSKYFDADGHALDAVILEGDVSKFRLNGQPITSGQQIPANLINAGGLVFLAQNTDAEINISVTLKAKDELGAVSN